MSDPSNNPPISGNAGIMYALGELKGQMTAVLQGQTAQADVNTANEAEHAKFRDTLAKHDTAIDGFTRDRADSQRSKLTGLQVIGLWIAAIGGVGGVISAIFFITHP